MSLPETYLAYPKRRYGQDMERYRWAPATGREPVTLPDGRTLAVSVIAPCEFHPIDPNKAPFGHPAGMVTPYPDLRHFTTRDYGNRVGVFRILDALKGAGIAATFPVSAALIDRARPLIEAIVQDGHEIAAAGLHGDAIHHSALSAAEEGAMIARTREAFSKAGLEPKTWLSPARQESFATPDLLTEHGFSVVLDWEIDQIPVALRTAHGPLTALPHHNELEDFKLLIERRQSEAVWRDQILEAADRLCAEAPARGGQAMAFTVTPFVAGQPFRIGAFEAIAQALAADARIVCATASDAAAMFA